MSAKGKAICKFHIGTSNIQLSKSELVTHLNFLNAMNPPIILLLLGDGGAGWSDGNERRNVISQHSNRSVSHSLF